MQRGRVEVDSGGPLLLFAMILLPAVEAVGCTVLEGHVLQFALATCVADGVVEGMIAEEQLQGGLGRACAISGVSVWTTMPSVTGVVQAVWSHGIFSMRTTHMRQAAWRVRARGSSRRRGSRMPADLQASMSSVARGGRERFAVYYELYGLAIVGLRTSMLNRDDRGSGLVALDVVLELLAELLDEA